MPIGMPFLIYKALSRNCYGPYWTQNFDPKLTEFFREHVVRNGILIGENHGGDT
jgi:hypothetical protein